MITSAPFTASFGFENILNFVDDIELTEKEAKMLQQEGIELKLNKDGEIKASVKCQEGNFGLTAFLTEYGSKCLLMLALEDLQEHFIGMLTIEFAYDREEFSEDELIFITQKTSVIGTLLSTFVKK